MGEVLLLLHHVQWLEENTLLVNTIFISHSSVAELVLKRNGELKGRTIIICVFEVFLSSCSFTVVFLIIQMRKFIYSSKYACFSIKDPLKTFSHVTWCTFLMMTLLHIPRLCLCIFVCCRLYMFERGRGRIQLNSRKIHNCSKTIRK